MHLLRFHIMFNLVVVEGICPDNLIFFSLFIITRHFSFTYIFYMLVFGLPVFYITMTHSTSSLSNLFLDLNFNMNLNATMTMHDDSIVKYQQPDTLHEPVLFEPVSCAIFKVTSFIEFRHYIRSFILL